MKEESHKVASLVLDCWHIDTHSSITRMNCIAGVAESLMELHQALSAAAWPRGQAAADVQSLKIRILTSFFMRG